MATFKDFLFNKFPYRFRERDLQGPVIGGEGLLQRVLQVLGLHLDEYVVPHLENHLNLRDSLNLSIITTDDGIAYLETLASDLSNPPDANGDITAYRKLCRYLIYILETRGSYRAYQYFFSLYGFVPIIAFKTSSGLFDEAIFDIAHFDTLLSRSITLEYTLTLHPITVGSPPPTQELLDSFAILVKKFLQPITLTLTSIGYDPNSADGEVVLQWPESVQSTIPLDKSFIIISND